MKQLCKLVNIKAFLAILVLSLFQTLSFAQDSGGGTVTTTSHSETQSWYVQPWVWVVGGAIFLIIIIALVRGSGRSDRVTVTKTTTTDTDV